MTIGETILIDIGVILAFIGLAIAYVKWFTPKGDDPTHMRKI